MGANSAELMLDSNASIDAMVADIDAAEDHVHLLFYIWLPDNNGCKMVEALKRAAGRGVTCRAMVDALGTTLSRGQQIVGVFMLGMSCGQIPSGLASDRFGRLPAIYVGMGVFFAAGLVASFANSIDLLLAARFVQGFGAASAIVVSRAVVRDIASGKEAARLMSLMTMIFTATPVIAPSIGALLVTSWNWRAPLIVIVVCAALLLLGTLVDELERRDLSKGCVSLCVGAGMGIATIVERV